MVCKDKPNRISLDSQVKSILFLRYFLWEYSIFGKLDAQVFLEKIQH